MNIFDHIVSFYRISPPVAVTIHDEEIIRRRTRQLQLQTFFAALLGHSLYYVCRTTLNVVKTPLVNSHMLNDQQLGVVGSAMLFAYAIGKFVNSFLADRSNIRRFMATGLIISSLVNLFVGIFGYMCGLFGLPGTVFFLSFSAFWAVNGWAQSMGTAPPIVSLSRWFPQNKRGTYYGFFSSGHNIGEFLSFGLVGTVVGYIGWREGFLVASVAGLIGVMVICSFLHDSPESMGLPTVGKKVSSSFKSAQLDTLKNPYVWILALSSGCMYVARYAINGWGVRFLEVEKGYSLQTATWVVGLNAMAGILGAVFSGWFSDFFFKGKRNIPALFFGVLNTVALIIFLFFGNNVYIVIASMLLFGLSIGALICFLGGLMAVDIAPRNASGAAVGMVGLVSYICAGCQDVVTGMLIENNKTVSAMGEMTFNFTPVSIFWISASVLSFLLALLVWRAKRDE